MKHILLTLIILLLTTLGGNVYAQRTKSDDDFYLRKAYEVLEKEADEKVAFELVDKQLRETPDNVDALLLHSRLLRHQRDFGSALQDINHALKVNKPRKTDIPNSTLHWWRGAIYEEMRDADNAVAAYKASYELAQKDDRENLQSIAFDYAQALYSQKDLDAADAVYRRMLADDECDQGAMIGLARNMIFRGEYREAVEMLDKCQKYDAGYSEVYRFKMQAYDKLGEAADAIDAGLTWFEKSDDPNTAAILDVLKKRPAYAETGIKSRIKASDDAFSLKALLAFLYSDLHRYAAAVKVYDELEAEYGSYDDINIYRSDCYSELGLNGLAVADISKVMDEDVDWRVYCNRGDYYRLLGDLDAALADFSAAAEEAPRESFPYYRRGWCYEMKGDRKRALEDYNLGLEIDQKYPYLFLMRGELLALEGRKAEADADFEQILQIDTVANRNSCRMYALHFLGRDREAEEWMDKVIATDPEEAGNYYDRACLYSRMGRLEDSVAALRVAFEKGYRSFSHIRMDDDMDAVRELPEYQALMDEYEAKHAEYLQEFKDEYLSEKNAVKATKGVKYTKI